MAGPMLNLAVFRKSTPHTLRAISLAIFPPAFILLLIQGIASHRVNPAIGILPLFFSSAFAALLLANERRCGCQSSGLTGTPVHLILDLCLAISLLVCLILTWVHLGLSDRCLDNMATMLGTYGTNFLGCNFLIHVYFVGRQLVDSLTPGLHYPMSCPQCQHEGFSVRNLKLGMKLRDGYAPLLDEEGAPRNSGEEHTANTGESMA